MYTSETLKNTLRQIKHRGYRVLDDLDIDVILDGMLHFIGHPDPELRDELIYSTFNKWSTGGIISAAQMKRILDICVDGWHLFLDIGEKCGNAVFTRSFSVLLVPLALEMNSNKAFLSAANILDIKEAIIKYAKAEKDYRGYVNDNGWAHAIAHTADALAEIAKTNCIGPDDLLDILNVIKEMVFNKEHVYICEEDERLVTAFETVYKSKVLADKVVFEWFEDFKIFEAPNSLLFDENLRMNKKNFLRSLYFRSDDVKELQEYIFGILKSYQLHYWTVSFVVD